MKKRYTAQIFSHNTLPAQATQGSLLVSEPFLEESYFRHAVISLIRCSPSTGAMGLVLNNRLDLSLHEVLDGMDRHVSLYCGGPLSQDRLFFIHTLGPTIIPDAQPYAPVFPLLSRKLSLQVVFPYHKKADCRQLRH